MQQISIKTVVDSLGRISIWYLDPVIGLCQFRGRGDMPSKSAASIPGNEVAVGGAGTLIPRLEIHKATLDMVCATRAEPVALKIGIPELLLILSPWTLAIPVEFAGVRPLQFVAFGLLVVSLHRRSLSRLNAIAHGLISCIVASLLWALVLTISAQDRQMSGSSGVLAEIDNTMTPVLWIAAAGYAGLLSAAQREMQVALLMRSMLALSACNLMLQFAQLAHFPWAFSLVRYPEIAERLAVSSGRAPGIFEQCGELGFFLGIMVALVLGHRKASAPEKATALLLTLLSAVAAADKSPLYVLLVLLLVNVRHLRAFVLALIAGALAFLFFSGEFLANSFEVLIRAFRTEKGPIYSLSSGRFGGEGIVSSEVARLIAEQPLGLGYGGRNAGLVTVAYDSDLLTSVAVLGIFGLAFLFVLLSLLALGAALSDRRLQAFSLLLVFVIAAQDVSAISANNSSAFFWLGFTMIALLRNHEVDRVDKVTGAYAAALTPGLAENHAHLLNEQAAPDSDDKSGAVSRTGTVGAEIWHAKRC